ncbi:MAG: FeoB-associated Cys-rich membrane protein [Deltaproteobacteria bacterium]|nr:FeoB-associated Cys-rich membrane protein [Deltaproteobacteria bacterium]
MENLLVILIVFLAGLYIVRTYYKRLRKQGDCGCECSSCDIETTCNEPTKNSSQDL